MEVEFPYEIRWAKAEEWRQGMDMVWRTFLKFEGDDYTAEGIRNFYDFITDQKLYQSFLEGSYQVMVALDDGRVIGLASVRNRHHLSLLFVDEMYHKREIGRHLIDRVCDYLKEEAGEIVMTVNAAPYAVEFYRHLGFCVMRPEEQIDGIRITLMEKAL